MPSTYMDLTNRLLRRLNEVEISEADFLSVRGIQATAKDCVLDTVREINSSRIDWPFNAVEHSQQLVVGTEEYAWPVNFSACDWNSFQIQRDDTLNIKHSTLRPMNREEWYANRRDRDYDSENDGLDIPRFAFPSHGQGFGVSPSPNQTYTIKYRYYKNPTDPILYNDAVTIPDKFNYVIMAGSLYHMNLFKSDAEGVAAMEKKFDKGIKDMGNMFLPNPIYMYDGRVNF